MAATNLPKMFGIILYPGFQLLDVCGPLDALNVLASSHTINLSIIAATLDPVRTHHFKQGQQGSNINQSITPTHTFDTAPQDLEVLIIPGGLGNRNEETIKPAIDYLSKLQLGQNGQAAPHGEGAESSPRGDLKWILTVCTGSEMLARTGALNGRRATTNKRVFNEVHITILACSNGSDD